MRDYTTGDSFGRIHWPLSAHHGRLMSKTFEQPLTTDIWILLDLDRKVHFGEGEESTVEYAISLAASMASQVHSRGRQVGLIANDATRHVPRAAPGGPAGPPDPRLPRRRPGGRAHASLTQGARVGPDAAAAASRHRRHHAERRP